MKLIAAKCPNCGADIEVDKNSDSTKCDYCGKKIIVEEAVAKYKLELSGKVEVSNSTSSVKLLKLGDKSFKDSFYKDALEKYERALEMDPDDCFIEYMISVCKMFISHLDISYMKASLRRLLNLEFVYDSNYKKDCDVSSAVEMFIICVKEKVNSIKKNLYFSHNDVSNAFNLWKEMLSFLEELNDKVDVDVSTRILLLCQINDLIFLMLQKHKYINVIYLTYHPNTSDIKKLVYAKEKYYHELFDLNSSLVNKYKYIVQWKI